MGCCSVSARQAASAGARQDEVELLEIGGSRKWSISEAQSESSLHLRDHVITTETGGNLILDEDEDVQGRIRALNPQAAALWGRTRAELRNFLFAQPIAGWEGESIHSLGEIVWSSLVFMRTCHMEEMSERYLVLFSFQLLILSVDHMQKTFTYQVPCDEPWKKRKLMKYLSYSTILKWEGKPIQHLGPIHYLAMVQVAYVSTGNFVERLLVLFAEDLVFLSIDSERAGIAYEGKLPLAGIQAKEKSALLGRLEFEITGSLMEPILVTCSTAEDYEKCLFHLQKPEENLDTVTVQPPPMVPKKSQKR
ncbi:uncharacterized protein LOC102445242 isoform X6 [Pelodiscus sinensis]|uniref:uncharacterized protein LOC102445242 isoform X6 n=1 Tax=Pelodiscus sinensis TaxID=13735 RepID=UPI003F6D0527